MGVNESSVDNSTTGIRVTRRLCVTLLSIVDNQATA